MNNTGLPKNDSEQLISRQESTNCKFDLCLLLASTINNNYMCYFNLCYLINCKCKC